MVSTFTKVIIVHKMKADHQRSYQLTRKLICVTDSHVTFLFSPPIIPLSLYASSAFHSARSLQMAQVRSLFLKNAQSSPSRHLRLCICICAFLSLYTPQPAWQYVNIFLAQSAEQFCAALCLAVGCFELRSKFNKPAFDIC